MITIQISREVFVQGQKNPQGVDINYLTLSHKEEISSTLRQIKEKLEEALQ